MKLLITSNLPDEIYNNLPESLEIDYHNSNIPLSEEEIKERVVGKDFLICPLSDKINKDIIDQGKDLKLIMNYGAGFDNIDINYAKGKNIIVTNAPAPSSAVSTAELAFGLILAISRRLIAGEKDLRDGNFLGWRPTYFLGDQLKGKTLGIIGMGNIGKNLAKRALAFEMDVIYYSRTRKKDIEKLGVKFVDKEDLMRNSDIVSIHTAFSKDLKHMISKEDFNLMKESAFLINAARGPLVSEENLIDALKNKRIKGAALDVYEFEPKVSDELLSLDNVVLIPHLGNATWEARMEMGQAVLDNLKDFLDNKEPRNKVN